MVKLQLLLKHTKGRKLFLKRIAPVLPNGFFWHKGLEFDDGVQPNEVWDLEVCIDGTGLVRLRYDLFGDEDFDCELRKRLDAGWQIDDGEVVSKLSEVSQFITGYPR